MPHYDSDNSDLERILDRLDRIATAIEELTAAVVEPDPPTAPLSPHRTLEAIYEQQSTRPDGWDLAFELYMYSLHIVEHCNCYSCVEWMNRRAAALHRHTQALEGDK